MDAIKSYLLSVTAAALICCIVSSLAGKGSSAKILKLLCGIFLTAAVIKPAVDIRLGDIYAFTDSLTVSSDLAVSQGEKFAAEEMKRIIKQKTEAYILDKAKSLGAEISVEVALNDYVPATVTIVGEVSPFVRSSLSTSIAQELDIPPEEQIWKKS